MSQSLPKFVMLAILDGWGIAPDGPGNAITLANTPNFDRLWASYPHTKLSASGQSVGLPQNEDGNTETGHLNLGAGRVIYQDLERINLAIAEGSFFRNEVLQSAIKHAKDNNSDLHFMGLVGAGGVHSNIHHLFALLQLARKEEFDRVYIHVFTDGRDSPPTSSKTYIKRLKDVMQKERVGVIASVMGRYWAMDRDQRWDRTEKAYLALTKGKGKRIDSVESAIDSSYAEGITDEFIEPSLVIDSDDKPVALINDNDAIIFFNFRIDRPRQLTKAFLFDDMDDAAVAYDFDPHQEKYESSHSPDRSKREVTSFVRKKKLENLRFVSMTEYSKPLTASGAHPAFPPLPVEMPLGWILSVNNVSQLRITESEKERFVSYYFNGLHEEPFENEDRIIVPSPAVPTYDQKPEMSADLITNKLLSVVGEFKHQFVVVNYPNVDMVGHTGNIGPTVRAVEKVDECLGKLVNFVHAYDGVLIVVSDHGNGEEMINKDSGEIDTEHSANKVPFIFVSKRLLGNSAELTEGILADVAPTILSVLKIPITKNMTGRNLIQGLWN